MANTRYTAPQKTSYTAEFRYKSDIKAISQRMKKIPVIRLALRAAVRRSESDKKTIKIGSARIGENASSSSGVTGNSDDPAIRD